MRTIGTVTLGIHKTHDACRASLEANSIKVSQWAEDIRKKTPLSQTPTDIELIEVSLADLGFDEATRFDAICKRVVERGFDLCPAEAAIMLRESSKDQPKGEWRTVVMEAIPDSSGYPNVFSVEHRVDGLWLDTGCGGPDYLFYPAERFVVARRK